MGERLASDIAADLREWTSGDPEFGPLLIEAADKLEGLIACLAAAERERDQAIAQDRQPYPTRWAYDQACKALEKHRRRANSLAVAMRELRRGACAYSDLNTDTATNHDVIAAYVNDVHRMASEALAKDDDVCSREPDLTDPERAALEALRLYRKGFTAYFLSVLGPNRGPGTLAHLIAAVDALEPGFDPSSGEVTEEREALKDECICPRSPHDYGSAVVYEQHSDGSCPVHGYLADEREPIATTTERCDACGTTTVTFDPPLVFNVEHACGALKPGTYASGADLPLCDMPRGHDGDHVHLVERTESWRNDPVPSSPDTAGEEKGA